MRKAKKRVGQLGRQRNQHPPYKIATVTTGMVVRTVISADSPAGVLEVAQIADAYAKHVRSVDYWLWQLKAQAHAVLRDHGYHADEAPWPQLKTDAPDIAKDARDLLVRVHLIAQARKDGNTDPAIINALLAGRLSKQIAVRPFEPLVCKSRCLRIWRGRVCQPTPMQAQAIDCIGDRDSVLVTDLYKAAYGETYDAARDGDKMRRFLSRLRNCAGLGKRQLIQRDGEVLIQF